MISKLKRYLDRGVWYLKGHKKIIGYTLGILLVLPLTLLLSGQKQTQESHASALPLAIDVQTGKNQTTASNIITSPRFTTRSGNELIVVFLTSDGAVASPQLFNSVSTETIHFTLARRANGQKGTAEIWYAYVPNQLKNARVTATRQNGSYHGMMRVVSFTGASNQLGGTAGGSGIGNPVLTMLTIRANSKVFAIANDSSRSTAQTAGPNQFITQQYRVNALRTAFWTQQTTTSIPTAGTQVVLTSSNNMTPATDAWNMVALEVVPAAALSEASRTTIDPVISKTTTLPNESNNSPESPINTSFPPADAPANVTNTGFPAGTVLTEWSEGKSGFINVSNQTYDGALIPAPTSGYWQIYGNNLTFRNCKFNAGVTFYGDNIRVEHCDITGGISLSGTGNVSVLYNNIHGWDDGIHITSDSGPVTNVTVSYNFVHDPIHPTKSECPTDEATPHEDAIQLLGVNGLTVTYNTLDVGPWYLCNGFDVLNSALQIENTQGPDVNMNINYNYVNGGGITARFYACSNTNFIGNRFGKDARYGPFVVNDKACLVNKTGNVMEATNQPLNMEYTPQ